MRIEALALIDGEPELQRLVVTWPVVGQAQDVVALGLDNGSPTADVGDDLAAAWEAASGVDRDDVQRRAPILFANEILTPEGVVDPAALGFIRQRIVEKLPVALRQRLATQAQQQGE